jgi:hypothetical protein
MGEPGAEPLINLPATAEVGHTPQPVPGFGTSTGSTTKISAEGDVNRNSGPPPYDAIFWAPFSRCC